MVLRPYFKFSAFVGIDDKREEWDLLGVPCDVRVCILITVDPKFNIYSVMVTEVGARPLFTPFQ